MKTKSILFCLVTALCANIFVTVYGQAVNKQDSLALVDLYNSTDGPNWLDNTNWLTGQSVSAWYGVTVENGRVTQLILYSNNLTGIIPASLGNLTNLWQLWLHDNQLSGSIPASLGKLENLGSLYLSSNQLSGNIPSSIGNLVNLQILNLFDNQLSGRIPYSLGNLTNLHWLLLGNNQLNGSIPSALGKLSNLDGLSLDHNKLSGLIPSSLGNVGSSLSLGLSNNMDLSYNQLSGRIPHSFGKLRIQEFAELNLSHNQLSGQIPNSLSKIANSVFATLRLDYNRFTFAGMEKIANAPYFATYCCQANIPSMRINNTLYVSAGGTLSHNTYKWFRVTKTGNAIIATIAGDSVFHPSQSGTYFAKVTNSIATELTLKSETINYGASSQFVASASPSCENALQQHNKTNLFLVYPNPAKDVLYVQTNGKAILSLTDQSGKILFTKNINGKEEINVANLSAGIYYLRNNETGAVQKVIVAR